MSIAGESDMPVTTLPESKPPKRIVCNKRAAGTSQTRTRPSADAASTHRPSLENSRHVAVFFSDEEGDPPHRNVRTRRKPATSTTRVVASPHATATKPLGACPFAVTIFVKGSFPFPFEGVENKEISPRSFCSLNAQTRTTPSSAPHVTNDSLLPSATTAATTPSCAPRRAALFFINASAP